MLTFVIARYKEDLGWLHQLPAGSEILVYNKGPALAPEELPPGARVIPLENAGRESDTYLQHLTRGVSGDPEGFTVFTQGGPFEHAPWLLDLVQASAQWRDIQPLSTQWLAEKQIPPARLVEGDQRNWVQDMPVRAEHFSLHTWAPLAFHDVGAWKIGLAYQSIHSLPAGSNLAAHFYQQCGLPALAERAAQADVGVFSYGAIFAVRNRRLQAFVAQHAEQLPRMIALTRSQETHGYMFERAWLHLFGEPFARLAALSEVPLPAVTSPASAARPAATAQDTVSALRTQALAASQAGQADEAVALLQQALQIDPGHVEAIADLAALALNQGHSSQAEALARIALARDPDHGTSLFVLASAQEGLGQTRQAADTWQTLVQGPAAQRLAAEGPELLTMARGRLDQLLQAA